MIVTLTITSWATVPNMLGTHFYGVLRCPGQKPTRLERTIDRLEARRLNAYDNTPGLYKDGSTTERFPSADAVRTKAQEVWVEQYPKATEMKEKS